MKEVIRDMYRRDFNKRAALLLGVAFIGTFILAWQLDRVLNHIQKPGIVRYVSEKGLDTNSGTSTDQAYGSIQKALEMAQPGDTIQIADGKYMQSIHSVRDGKKDRPITITGSSATVLQGDSSRIVEIRHNYIHLVGFRIDGKFGNGDTLEDYRDKLIYVQGSRSKQGVTGLKIDGMTIENGGGECVRLRYFATDNEVTKSTIRNCGIYDFVFGQGGKNGEGIYVGTAPEQTHDGKNPDSTIDESSGNWIHDNLIETHGNECVDVKEGSHNNLIERNRCTAQQDSESGGMDARGNNNIFRDNEIYDNHGAGMRLGGDEENDGIENQVYNNTFKNNQNGGIKFIRDRQSDICGNNFDEQSEPFTGTYASSYSVEKCD